MSRLEDFIGRGKSDQPDFSLLEKNDKSYQCIECEESSDGSYFDPIGMTIYWYCKNEHVSKVSLVGGNRD